MCKVCQARDTRLGRDAAIKLLPNDFTESTEQCRLRCPPPSRMPYHFDELALETLVRKEVVPCDE